MKSGFFATVAVASLVALAGCSAGVSEGAGSPAATAEASASPAVPTPTAPTPDPSPSASVGTLAYGLEQWESGMHNTDATEMYTALFVIANRAEEDCLAGLEASQGDWLREKVDALKTDLAGVGEGTTGADLLILGSSTVKAISTACNAS